MENDIYNKFYFGEMPPQLDEPIFDLDIASLGAFKNDAANTALLQNDNVYRPNYYSRLQSEQVGFKKLAY